MADTQDTATPHGGQSSTNRDLVATLWFATGFGAATLFIGVTDVVSSGVGGAPLGAMGATILVAVLALVVVFRE